MLTGSPSAFNDPILRCERFRTDYNKVTCSIPQRTLKFQRRERARSWLWGDIYGRICLMLKQRHTSVCLHFGTKWNGWLWWWENYKRQWSQGGHTMKYIDKKILFPFYASFQSLSSHKHTRSLKQENSWTQCFWVTQTVMRSKNLVIKWDPRARWLSSCLWDSTILWLRAHKWEMPGGQRCLYFWAAFTWDTFLRRGV